MTLIVCPNCQQNIQGITVHILAPFEDGECPHCGEAFVISVGRPTKRATDGSRVAPDESARCPDCGNVFYHLPDCSRR